MNVATKTTSDTLDFRRYGYLAYVYCKQREEVQVLKSNAGFYIGTLSEGLPCSRESNEYYASEEAAVQALCDDTWTQKVAP